jgi:hypothetical protein
MKLWKILPLVLIAGCTGVDGEKFIGAPGSPAWFSTASPNTVATYFRDRCTAYGFVQGTPEMAQCIQQEAASKRQSNAIRGAAIASANQANIANANANRVRHTTCNRFGNTVNCSSF